MRTQATYLCALALGILYSVALGASGQPEATAGRGESSETTEGQPIDSGFVVLGGRYIPLPYVVGYRGDEVFINGHSIPVRSMAFRRGFAREEREEAEGAGRRRPYDQQPDSAMAAARIERRLLDEELLLELEGETASFVFLEDGPTVLGILLSDDAKEVKVRSLIESGEERLTSAQWARLLGAFQPSAELRERIRKYEEPWESPSPYEPYSASPQIFSFASVKHGMTVGSMVLAVVALGVLISHRPAGGVRWSDLDRSGDGVALLVQNVALVVVLSLFDLACTLVARQSGGFLEMNPLGNQLIGNPYALVTFKVGFLVASAALLLGLRRYRGAQIASWWLVLACTVLAFRWATYNSMFLT